jgi:hypothetical protein
VMKRALEVDPERASHSTTVPAAATLSGGWHEVGT